MKRGSGEFRPDSLSTGNNISLSASEECLCVAESLTAAVCVLVPQRADDQLRHVARRRHRQHRAWAQNPQPPHHQQRHPDRLGQLQLSSVQH